MHYALSVTLKVKGFGDNVNPKVNSVDGVPSSEFTSNLKCCKSPTTIMKCANFATVSPIQFRRPKIQRFGNLVNDLFGIPKY